MKSVWKLTSLLLLLIVSFIYTDKVFSEVKKTDPVMKKINSYEKKVNVKPVEPIITDDEIILGISGLKINKKESYNNMKSNKEFDKEKIVYDKVLPKNSINKNYNYYITRGNTKKKNISIIFKVSDEDDINDILLINKDNIKLNLFIDGVWLEQNTDAISKINKENYEIYNLGYNGKYKRNTIKFTNNMIESITLKKSIFCLNEDKNDASKKICARKNMYTIKPGLIDPSLVELRNNLENGLIISYDLSNFNTDEFNILVNTITKKGYNIVGLSKLIKE